MYDDVLIYWGQGKIKKGHGKFNWGRGKLKKPPSPKGTAES